MKKVISITFKAAVIIVIVFAGQYSFRAIYAASQYDNATSAYNEAIMYTEFSTRYIMINDIKDANRLKAQADSAKIVGDNYYKKAEKIKP